MKKSILSLLLACFLQINLAFAQNVMKGVVSDAKWSSCRSGDPR